MKCMYTLLRSTAKCLGAMAAIILGTTGAYAQAPAIQWQQTYGGSHVDGSNSVQRTPDGGYIMGGYSNSADGQVTGAHGSLDCWLVKTDSAGALQWERTYGGSAAEQIDGITIDVNGGYVLAGATASNDGDATGYHGGGDDGWLIKTNDTGGIVWSKVLGSSGFDYFNQVYNTADSGYIAVGGASANDGDVSGLHGGTDCWVVRLDKNGNVLWSKVYGGPGYDYGLNGSPAPNGDFMIIGAVDEAGGDVSGFHGGTSDVWVVRTNDTGGIVWQHCYGGSNYDQGLSIATTADNGFAFTATTNSADGDVTGLHGSTGTPDEWIVKIDSAGTLKWQHCYGGTQTEQPNTIIQTQDGGYATIAYTTSNDGDVSGNHGGADYWLLKIDDTGTIQWQGCYGGPGNDSGIALMQNTDGSIVLTGGTNSTSGDVTSTHGSEDFWLVKLNATTAVSVVNRQDNISVYPVPTADGLVHVTMPAGYEQAQLLLTDPLGRNVPIGTTGTLQRNVNLSSQPKGLYLLQVCNGSKVSTFSVVYR